jgi:acetolactate synthase-1/2/3 large subunit
MAEPCGAEILVRNLKAQGVTRVFGVPGAKIDRVFDALLDSGIETVVCRHEQNASFIAQGLGRITGKAGVCLVTSGPGTTNLVTGFATATSEGSPVVGFGGVVPRVDRLKQAHQSLDTASLLRGVSKYSVEVDSEAAIGEVVANAFRAAESPRPGAAFVALPNDVMNEPASARVLTPVSPARAGAAPAEAIAEAARLINQAKAPVILFGMLGNEPRPASAARKLLAAVPLPVTVTFQASGIVPRELVHLFAGRVGLFHNQPGDRLLDAADIVITIGYDPIEYDEALWNRGKGRPIVHIDPVPCDIDAAYKPTVELTGDIADTLAALTPLLHPQPEALANPLLKVVVEEMTALRERGAARPAFPAILCASSRSCSPPDGRRDSLPRYGLVPHLACPLSACLSAAPDADLERPADPRRGTTLGDRRLPGATGPEGDLGLGRRGIPLLLRGAGNGGPAQM